MPSGQIAATLMATFRALMEKNGCEFRDRIDEYYSIDEYYKRWRRGVRHLVGDVDLGSDIGRLTLDN
jgi:hypothetical protein